LYIDRNMKTEKYLTIKDWAEQDRPREKLLAKGIASLSDAELIAILIGSGNKNESAVELSKKILKESNNNLSIISKLNVNDLKKFKGIGRAKAINIIAAFELGRRNGQTNVLEKNKITNSKDVFEFFHPKLCTLPYEEFWVLYLNRSNKIIDHLKISQGGISGTVADSRIILKKAIEKLATSIVLVHNHPSGNNQPSKSDINLTQKLITAGKTLDINVLDHIIIADSVYFSFADEGMMRVSEN